MTLRQIFRQAAKELGIPVDTVEEIFLQRLKCIQALVDIIPTDPVLTREEFRKYKSRFHIKYVGSFELWYQGYLQWVEYLNYKKKKGKDYVKNYKDKAAFYKLNNDGRPIREGRERERSDSSEEG